MGAQGRLAVVIVLVGALIAAACGSPRADVISTGSGTPSSSPRATAGPPANQISMQTAADTAAAAVVPPPGWTAASRIAQPSGGAPTSGSESLDAVACFSAARCVAVGEASGAAYANQVLVTDNGGRTWRVAPHVPEPARSTLRGLACASSSLCVAVGRASRSEILRSTDGAGTWETASQVPQPVEGASLRAVACASVTLCVAVGGIPGASAPSGEILRSTDGGVDWSAADLPTPAPGDLRSVVCPSATLCVAVGTSPTSGGNVVDTVLRSTDGGKDWARAQIPAPPAGTTPNPHLASVACSETELCVATGWESVSGSGPTPVILVSSGDGATWTAVPRLPALDMRVRPNAAAVACASATRCVAAWSSGPVGYRTTALRTTNGGRWWDTVAVPAGLAVTSLACEGSSCVAVGDTPDASFSADDALRSTDGGGTWSYAEAVPQPGGTSQQPARQALTALACPAPTNCLAVGWYFGTNARFGALVDGPLNEVLRGTDGGGTWRAAVDVAQPSGTNGIQMLRGLACAATTLCVAVGDTAAHTDQNTDNEVLISGNGGTSWVAAPTVPQPSGTRTQFLRGVSCPTAQLCVTVGSETSSTYTAENEILRSVDGGQTWAAAATVPQPDGAGGQGLTAVDCSASGDCVAVGHHLDAAGGQDEILRSTDGGRSWVLAAVPAAPASQTPGDQGLQAVSCPTSTLCLAVGSELVDGQQRYQALISRDGGQTWTAETVPAPPAGSTGAVLKSVWCSATLACGAAGTYDIASGQQSAVLITKDAGNVWTAVQRAPAAADYQSLALTALACGAGGSCLAVGTYSPGAGQLNEVLLAPSLEAAAGPTPAEKPAAVPTTPRVGPGGLHWTAPPAPWTVGSQAVDFGHGDIGVVLQRAEADGGLPPQAGVGVLERGRWRAFALPPGESVRWLRPLGPGVFAMYGAETYQDTVLETTFAVYAGGTLTPLPLPAGQIPTSVIPLPSGGFAVGTGYRSPCGTGGCPAAACPHGDVVLVSGGTMRLIQPPAAPVGPAIQGGGMGGPVCAVGLGPVANGVLWLAVDGVGIAGLDLQTGTLLPLSSTAGGSSAYVSANYAGPLEILGVTASTVYFSVHRIPGIADAGYWAGLDAVPTAGGTVRTTMPADPACIRGGAGAPSALDVVGGRLWVGWGAEWCPLYDGAVHAASLAASTPSCTGRFSNTWAFLGDGRVVAACGLAAADHFFVFDGGTGAQTATFGLPLALTALGMAPTAPISLHPGGGGTLWLSANRGADTVFARVDGTTGAASQILWLPRGTALVTGATRDWFVGPAGVAEVTP